MGTLKVCMVDRSLVNPDTTDESVASPTVVERNGRSGGCAARASAVVYSSTDPSAADGSSTAKLPCVRTDPETGRLNARCRAPDASCGWLVREMSATLTETDDVVWLDRTAALVT